MLSTTKRARLDHINLREAYLFEELLLNGDVMVGDAKHDETVFGSFLLRGLICRTVSDDQIVRLVASKFANQLILDQNKRLHRMLQREFMFAHLRQNCTNIQMDIAWV